MTILARKMVALCWMGPLAILGCARSDPIVPLPGRTAEGKPVSAETIPGAWPPPKRSWTEAERKRQLERQTTGLPAADRVTVFALGSEAGANLENGFPLRTHKNAFAKVLASRELRGDAARSLAAAWRNQHFDPSVTGMCHMPAYGLRFFKGSEVVFDTSICWACQNFIAFIGEAADYEAENRVVDANNDNDEIAKIEKEEREQRLMDFGFAGFHAKDAAGQALLARLQDVLPHPDFPKLPGAN